tara:strand:- start:5559 stop:6794 length:1236 start_codon:yes stop_codon:yes gene_type:complete
MSATIVTTIAIAFDGSTFVDISPKVTRTSISYGRGRLLDEFSSGSARITYDNRDNSLTPGHSDSTYGNTQLIGREVRISTAVTGGSDSYSTYLFRGFVTDLDYVAEQNSSTVTITVTDGFDRLGQARFTAQNFSSAEKCGTRVARVLSLSSVDYPNGTNPLDRDIDTGDVETPAANPVTDNALDYIQQLTRTENGRFLINHAGAPSSTNFGGVLSWYSQNSSTTDRGISFSDSKSLGTGSVQMTGLTLEFGSELLFNSYAFTASTGDLRTGTDTASIAKYGERVVKRTLLCDNTATTNAGVYYINLYSEPSLRISSVTTDVDAMTAADAEKCLHINVMSGITLSYLPPGSSTTLTGAYLVEGVNYDITIKDMASNASRIRATYATSAADTTGYWRLGDPVLSNLPTILAPG